MTKYRFLHESLSAIYPDKEFHVREDLDPQEVSIWNGETYVPFEYDATPVLENHALQLTASNWRDLREKRDKLIAETDWMANSDVTLTDDWKTYRQSLRDLPANTSDPTNPTWPTKPS